MVMMIFCKKKMCVCVYFFLDEKIDFFFWMNLKKNKHKKIQKSNFECIFFFTIFKNNLYLIYHYIS